MYARGPLWTMQLAVVLAIASTTFALPNALFERDDTCAANYTQCTQPGLPANFCCQKGTTCNLLAGGTTVLCCPDGSSCTTIQTISCTLSLQDPKAHPTAAVKTTELTGNLPTCGKGCCPWGYSCDDANGNCVMNADQSKKPNVTSSVSTATSSPTSTVSKGGASTTAAAVDTTSTATESTSTGAPAASETSASTTARHTLNTAAIVGGVVGGLLALSLLVAGLCVFRHKRKKAAAARAKRDTTQSFGNIISGDIISAPMPHADYHTQRLDFLAKVQNSDAASFSSSSPTAAASTHHQQQQEMRSHLPSDSPYSAAFTFPPHGVNHEGEGEGGSRSHHTSAEIGGLRNLTDRYSVGGAVGGGSAGAGGFLGNPPLFTPRGEHFHSGGSESINVFADPSTVGSPSIYNNPRDTTWTEFQHHADRKGLDSPVPTPGTGGGSAGGRL